MVNYYPPVNFHFQVTELGGNIDASFREVTGLSVQIQTDSLKEGGRNEYEHTIPVRIRYGDITLKRGVTTLRDDSALVRWLKNGIEHFEFEPKNFNIQLLNERGATLMQWRVNHALPKSWKFGDLNAERGEVLIESIELSIDHFVFETL